MDIKLIKQKAKEKFDNNKLNHIAASAIVALLLGAVGSLSLIVGGPLVLGQYNYFLKVNRSKENEVTEVTEVFSGIDRLSESILAYIFFTLQIMLWTLLFIIPGIIKSYSLSLTFIILADNPEMSGSDALKRSAEMMHGHKMELFKLHLSFIGWYLLMFVTFGFAAFYIQPHITLSTVEFYEQLKGNHVELV